MASANHHTWITVRLLERYIWQPKLSSACIYFICSWMCNLVSEWNPFASLSCLSLVRSSLWIFLTDIYLQGGCRFIMAFCPRSISRRYRGLWYDRSPLCAYKWYVFIFGLSEGMKSMAYDILRNLRRHRSCERAKLRYCCRDIWSGVWRATWRPHYR